jgi:hypothetical protein
VKSFKEVQVGKADDGIVQPPRKPVRSLKCSAWRFRRHHAVNIEGGVHVLNVKVSAQTAPPVIERGTCDIRDKWATLLDLQTGPDALTSNLKAST